MSVTSDVLHPCAVFGVSDMKLNDLDVLPKLQVLLLFLWLFHLSCPVKRKETNQTKTPHLIIFSLAMFSDS